MERDRCRPRTAAGYLQGNTEREKIFVHHGQWYSDHDVELRLDTAVTAIDRNRHQIVVTGGERIGYDKPAGGASQGSAASPLSRFAAGP